MNRSAQSIHKRSLDGACEESKNPPMPKTQPEPLHLRRIDAARNMRAVLCAVRAADLVRRDVADPQLGPIGTNGQTMVQTFPGSAEAVDAFKRLDRRKPRRGY